MGAGEVVGLDVGGSSIKGFVVDTEAGVAICDLLKVPAPEGFAPGAVLDAIVAAADELGSGLPVGVGFPAVVRDGVLLTDPTSYEYPGWKGLEIRRALADRLGRHVAVGNDADVAGEAEIRLGAARGRRGTVIVLTFGTGIGSAVYRDGILVPNVELGRIYLRGQDGVAEDHAASRVRDAEHLSWEEWAGRLQDYLDLLERVFAPDLIVVGGGISIEHERFLPLLDLTCEVVPAAFRNDAGPIGAALLAAAEAPTELPA
jgi:polyphosphate glucokinase